MLTPKIREQLNKKIDAFARTIDATIKLDGSDTDIVTKIDWGLSEIRTFLVDALCAEASTKTEQPAGTEKGEADCSGASSWGSIKRSRNVTGIDPAGRSLKSNDDAWASITAVLPNRITIDDEATTKGEDGSSWNCLRRVVHSGVEVM